jgi:DNA-binding NtrC family response regulator
MPRILCALSEHQVRARLLIAEDDRTFRSFLATNFRDDGYEVEEVCDGYALLQTLAASIEDGAEARTPCVVITDVSMPNVGGLDVLRWVRDQAIDLPFIVITAFGSRTTRDRATRLGAYAVLEKPFNLDDLRTAVLNAFAVARPAVR